MKGFGNLLSAIFEIRRRNELTYKELAELLESLADKYRRDNR